MIRRALAVLVLMGGVLVAPGVVGGGTPVAGAMTPVLTPLNPARLLDTRPTGATIDGQAQRTGLQQATTTYELHVGGRAGVPTDAAAVMLNVTAANPAGPGFITVYPCGIDRPLASNLNYTTTAVPNAVLAKIGTNGNVCIYTNNTTNIIADVNAYVPKGAAPTAVNPARLLDTRPGEKTIDGQAQQTGIQRATTTFELQVTGRAGVPTDAAAVMLNVTAANPAGPGFITVYPCGIDRPLASNLNYTTTAVPNAVLAKVGTGGKVCFYTENTANIIADVNGFVPAGAVPIPLDPARLLDTRPGEKTIDGQAQQTGIQRATTTFELQVTGRAGVPTDAAAVMLNVTAANPAGPGFITVYPCGIDRPLASNLNYTTTAVPNAVLAKVGTGGKVCLYTENTVNIVADVNGYVPTSTDTGGPTTTSDPSTTTSTTSAVTTTTTSLPTTTTTSSTTTTTSTTSTTSTTTSTTSTTVSTTPPTPAPTCPALNFTIPVSECAALVAVYTSTGGPNWFIRTGWNTTADPCSWDGVGCNRDNSHVEALSLERNNLSGTVPSEIGNLTYLTNLNLDTNQITAIAPGIGSLTNLKYLSVPRNRLSSLPSDIGDLANLELLFLEQNELTAVPAEIGKLANLERLHLSKNRLTALPPEIGNLTNLRFLLVGFNPLTAVPPEIGNLTNLGDLSLPSNRITALPSEIGDLTNLESLSVSGNQLTALPRTIGKLVNLTFLDANNNQLATLPSEIGDLTNLEDLILDFNKLTVIQPEIGKLTNLYWLVLDHNLLEDDVTTALNPLRIANKIEYLSLNGNRCLGTRDIELQAWLTSKDFGWNAGCTPVDASSITG